MSRRMISLFLALVLLLGCLPFSASAAEAELEASSPYELRTDTGGLILTIHLPASWKNIQVTTENNSFDSGDEYYYMYSWSFCDSEQAQLFRISLNSFGWDGEGIHILGEVSLDPEEPSCTLLFSEPYYDPPYDAADNSEEAVAYRKMKKDISAIRSSVELNPNLDWTAMSFSHELYVDTGESILTLKPSESWIMHDDVCVENRDNYINFEYQGTSLFTLFVTFPRAGDWVGMPFLYRDVIGTFTVDGRKGRLWFYCPNSRYPSFYPDQAYNDSIYQELRKDIPKILRSIKPNQKLSWSSWLLSDSGFTDVTQTAFYSDAVKWAVERSITSGTDMTRFSPKKSCTRAQAVTFLWRAAGYPNPQSERSSFTDVKAGSYYEKAVCWAVEQGITAGTSKTKFSPNAKCTRSQIVTFLWREAGKPATSNSGKFTDVSENAFYKDAVDWAIEKGITIGVNDTTFAPQNVCNRAQIVTFLYRNAATGA